MSIPHLLESLSDLFLQSRWKAAAKAADALRTAVLNEKYEPTSPFNVEEDAASAPAELEALLSRTSSTEDSNFAALISSTYRRIDWFYSGRAKSALYSQIVGPGSRYHHDAVRCGLFMLPPHYRYANHVHGADEIYIVVAGNGDWSLDRKAFASKGPGDRIEIPSMTVHALRTGNDPVLALWSWSGDISLGSYHFTD